MILNNKKYANTKALSKFDWGIKSDGDTPAVNWEYVTKINPFSDRGNDVVGVY